MIVTKLCPKLHYATHFLSLNLVFAFLAAELIVMNLEIVFSSGRLEMENVISLVDGLASVNCL